jgi:hypothetical protein
MRRRFHVDKHFRHEISFDLKRWIFGVAVYEGGFAVLVGPLAYEYDTIPY